MKLLVLLSLVSVSFALDYSKIPGSYKFKSKDNFFGDFLEALGTNAIFRFAAEFGRPSYKVSTTCTNDQPATDCTWTIIINAFFTHKSVYQLGVPYEHDTLDGRPAVLTQNLVGDNLLMEEQVIEDRFEATVTRTFTDDGFTAVAKTKDKKGREIVTKAVFSRV